jgi:glycosyltransferase involved in cell wall biosynthesis
MNQPGMSGPVTTPRLTVIIPALNEEATIPALIAEILSESALAGQLDQCIVVDNGSTDATAERARNAGATVIHEPRRGYGQACHTGALSASQSSDPASDILVFMDGDGSDMPSEIPLLANPVLAGAYDFVIASRINPRREPGSLLASQIFAGRLAGTAMRLLYGVRYTDMGPMRAITRSALTALNMTEMTYGWNLEMQMKAARAGLRILEVPTTCRVRRGGVSKVAGSLSGSVKAAYRILFVLARIALTNK